MLEWIVGIGIILIVVILFVISERLKTIDELIRWVAGRLRDRQQ